MTKDTKKSPVKTFEKGVRGGRIIATKTVRMPVQLGDQELLVEGAKLASAERALRNHEVYAASQKSQLNSTKKELDKDLRAQSKVVETKTKERDVLIQIEEDRTDKRFVLEYRMDTEKPLLVTRRLLADNEKQREMPLGDKKGLDLVELAIQCVKSGLTEDEVKKLAEKKKVDPAKLAAAVAEQLNKAKPAKGNLGEAVAKEVSAIIRAAEKLFADSVRSTDAAKLEQAAKDIGVPVDELTDELRLIEQRIEKPESK